MEKKMPTYCFTTEGDFRFWEQPARSEQEAREKLYAAGVRDKLMFLGTKGGLTGFPE